MTPSAPILVLAGPTAMKPVQLAASEALFGLHVEQTAAAADEWLENNHPPAIVLDAATSDGRAACMQVRYNPALANVPIVGLSESISDLAFAETFAWGVDDLCARDAESLGRRLRGIASAGQGPLSRRRGTAVVAASDRRGRVLVARTLRNAGYDVTFAVDGEEALEASLAADTDLVVWRAGGSDVPEGAGSPPARARAQGSKTPWVLGAAPKDVRRMRNATAGVERLAVYDAFGPPEDVLFVANDLVARGPTEARASARMLYGTVVSFRTAGADEDDLGYSYNVSAGGLYVRTLAPPARGSDVWIELRPPRTDRRVRIEGRVVWTRSFGPNDVATVPPGFGVQISGGSTGDLERYTRGYRAFAEEMSS